MNCNHRCYECHIPACPDRVRQSIGPRIVPMFADPPEWSADKVYSPLTLVIHNGATYMSRRCVPANTALPDTDPFYNESWVMVYDMNAQVAQYREEVAQLSQQVTDFGGKIDNWEQLIVQWTALIQGWQNQFPELTKALAAITERVAAIEPKLTQAQEDIAALQAIQQTHTEQIAANTQGLADLTPRVAAAETHLSALDEEQKVQDEHLNNLDASQTEQNTRIQAAHDLAVQAKNTADNNTQQITENAGKIAANAAEIANHAERLEALETSQGEQNTKIQANADAIAQAKTDIKQAAAAAQQVKDELTHTNARVDEVEQKNTEQDAAIAAETTRATQAETALDEKITAETNRATQAEQDLQTAIDAEKTRAEAAEKDLDSKITTETTSRTEADEAINQSIEEIKQSVEGVKGDYLPLSGGTMTGPISMGNQKIDGLAAPAAEGDATNKKYVDDADAVLNAAIQAETKNRETAITGVLQQIGELETGIEGDLAGYLPLTGGTMQGNLNMGSYMVTQISPPIDDGHVANKKYVDDTVQNAKDPALTGRVEALETSQAQQDTEISNLKNGTTALPYIKDTGDTVTGTYDFTDADLTVKTPTAEASPATKAYVDTKITDLENGSTALPYVKKTGDSMTGVLNMNNNKVTNVADPTANGDAVNYKTMNAMKTDLESQIENLSGLLDTANQKIQDLEQRVEELEQNPPQPVDPTTKFNQIDLSNYVGSLSGATVNTASDFKAALQYILDNNSGKHFYYGTDHAGTTWYFASDAELSALSNDSYTCGNGVQNNGTAVKETFKMNKYVEPDPLRLR